MGARPFTMLKEVYMTAFFQSIAFFDFIIPTAEDFAPRLLHKVYNPLLQAVLVVLLQETCLNFIVDQSSDIRRQRIINLSVVTRWRTFYIKSVDIGVMAEDASSIVSWILTAIEEIIGRNSWWRVNSICTDTCNTMR